MRKVALFLLGALTSISAASAQLDTKQLKSTCENITPQQRQMAKAAGYDVESLCQSLQTLPEQAGDAESQSPQTRLPRGSALPVDERGVLMPPFEQEQQLLNQGEQFADDDEENAGKSAYQIAAEKGQLKKYGYELFAGVPTTFAPATDIPAPINYQIGPGDTLSVQLLGKESSQHLLKVNRDGFIQFPELGPIQVAGLTLDEVRSLIKDTVAKQMIGVRAVVTLDELRTMRVFVLGEAFKPGSYNVSSLSTMTNALFVSGGITEIGSLRNVQLKRNGKLISKLDLYELLLEGDTSGDHRLLPGDVIFIPAVGKTVAIQGEVNRPAIYELKTGETLGDLLKMAGGLTGQAYLKHAVIERVADDGFRSVLDVNLADKQALKTRLRNGDSVTIDSALDEVENRVALKGHVHREISKAWFDGIRVSDLIHSIKDLKENPALGVGLVVRKTQPLRKIKVLKFDLGAVLESPKGQDDLELKPQDTVLVFNNEVIKQEKGINDAERTQLLDFLKGVFGDHGVRDAVLTEIVERMTQQTDKGGLPHVVTIDGNVKFPGTYPLAEGLSVRELVLLAGGLKEASYLGNAEVTRRDLSNQEEASISHINVNLLNELSGQSQFILKPKDKVSIYATPEYQSSAVIEISGEVRFPGVYEFRRGETLSQVIARAGGFTSMAHVKAAVFTRKDLKEQEQKQLDKLREQMREDIAASELEDAAAGKSSAIRDAEALLNALSEAEAVGRLVISLDKIMRGESEDVQLKDGDKLFIPAFRQEISVVGEVQHPTAHLFDPDLSLEDYLEKSGGLSQRADEDRIYVVRADGSVFLPNQSGWLSHQNELLNPGDTIVVPLDTDRIKTLTLWTQTSQIIYQLALGAAAISRL